MTHFVRERADQDWYLGLPVPPVVIRNIDEKTKQAVSESGGTWNPTSAIEIGGAGMELQCGAILTDAAAYPAAGKNWIFGDDDYFKFPADMDEMHLVTRSDTSMLHETRYGVFPREAQAVFNSVDDVTVGLVTRRNGAHLLLPIRVADGALLKQVEIIYEVTYVHTDVPEYLPRARIVQISADGVIEPVAGVQTDPGTPGPVPPDGWLVPTRPADGDAWNEGIGSVAGAPKSFPTFYFFLTVGGITVPQAIRVDRSKYDYAIEWEDEYGDDAFIAGQGSQIVGVVVRYWTPDLRPY